MISLIAAITKKTRAIGKNNDMLYHLPKDLQFFKETTLHHSIVMGYKTYCSLPKRPLPNRKNIVLSKSHNIENNEVLVLQDVESVLHYAEQNPSDEIFICGGSTLYEQFLPHADKLYLTLIEEKEPVDADTFFPTFEDEWKMQSKQCVEDKMPICFTTWVKK